MSSPTSTSTSTSTSSSSPPSRARPRVSAEHTLTRVRENQRRHRARRKDYIASLEQRLADAEAQLEAARAEIAVLRGERERERGVEPTEEYRDRRVTEEMFALEGMVEGGLMFEVPMGVENMIEAGDTSGMVEANEEVAVTEETGPPPCCEDQGAQVARVQESVECSECHTRPAPAPTESTTLCAKAYVLIAQQNFRGIDAGTIRLWLYQGYRRARREGEGCMVENGALFRLLDYISGV